MTKTNDKVKFKKNKRIKRLSETKLFMDAAVNINIPIDDIFDALDVHAIEKNREFIKGWATGVGGMAAGYIIGNIIVKKYFS